MKPFGNTGRFLTVKTAFNRHLLNAVASIQPSTREIEPFVRRSADGKVKIADGRMIDAAQDLLDSYRKKDNSGEQGINAPLPVIIVAFAHDANPIAPDRGYSVANNQLVTFEANDRQYHYRMRLAHLENRVQVAFFAETIETAKAMTTQVRLWFQQFGKRRFPIEWKFGGHTFELTGTFEDIEPADEIADLGERTDVVAAIWNLNVNFQMPYLSAPEPYQFDENGYLIGYPLVKDVFMDIQDDTRNQKGLWNIGHMGLDTTLPSGEWGVDRAD